jgi:hypothetical protein
VYFYLVSLHRGVLAKNSPQWAKSAKNLARITDREFQDLATIKPLVSTHGGDVVLRFIPAPGNGMKCQVRVSFSPPKRFDHHVMFDTQIRGFGRQSSLTNHRFSLFLTQFSGGFTWTRPISFCYKYLSAK